MEAVVIGSTNPIKIGSIYTDSLSEGINSDGPGKCKWTEPQPLFIIREVGINDYFKDKEGVEDPDILRDFFEKSPDTWYFYEVSTD